MAFIDEIIIENGVTSTGLVAAPEDQGGSALTITVEAGGELVQGVAKAGGEIHGTFGALLTDVTAETGAVIDLAYAATGDATSGLTLRGENTNIAEGTLRHSGAVVNGYAADGVLYDVSGETKWRFCIGDGITVSGATLTTGARIYAHEHSVINGATILQSGNIGLLEDSIGYYIVAGSQGVAAGKATLQITANAQAYHTTVSQGGQANIRAYAEDTTVFSGGKVTISEGGVASNLIVSKGGVVSMYGGTVSGLDAYLEASLILSGGVVSNINVQSGATVAVSSGATLDGGRIYGGAAYQETIIVSSGGTARNVAISGARMIVGKGGFGVSNTVAVGNVGYLVYGSAENTTVNGGWFMLYNGASAYDTTVNNGKLDVSSTTSATKATVNGGYINVMSNAAITDVTISRGSMNMLSGAVANDVLVLSGGMLKAVSGGATINNLTLRMIGNYTNLASVYGGRTTINNLYLSGGVHDTFYGVDIKGGSATGSQSKDASNTRMIFYLRGGTLKDYLITTYGDNTEANGAWIWMQSSTDLGGYGSSYASNITVEKMGRFEPDAGTLSEDIKVVDGGWMYMLAGASARNVLVSGLYSVNNRMASTYITSNGGITNAMIGSGGSLAVYGSAVGGYVSSGGSVNVYSGGLISGMQIRGGANYVATLQISSGGVASDISISGTRLVVQNGGTASRTSIDYSGAGMNVSKGGTAKYSILKTGFINVYASAVTYYTSGTGGTEVLSQGGKSISATFTAGVQRVSSGGSSVDALLNGGAVYVISGGQLSGAIVNKNATAVVSANGTGTFAYNPWQGTITSNAGATVNYLERDSEIYLANNYGLASRGNSFEDLEIGKNGSAIAYGGTLDSVKVYAGGSMAVSGAATVCDLVLDNGKATFSGGCGATLSGATVLNGGYLYLANHGIHRVDDLLIASGGTVDLRSGANLSIGDITVSHGGYLAINNMVAAARISGTLLLDLHGAKGLDKYMVFSSFHYVNNGSRVVKASEEVGNYTYKLVNRGGEAAASYNFTLDIGGNKYTLAKGASLIDPLAKMTYTTTSSSFTSGTATLYDECLKTTVDSAYTIAAVDTAAAVATNGAAVNSGDKMARWTADTAATSAVNVAAGMTAGNAWLELDGANLTKALYGTAENQAFTGVVNYKVNAGTTVKQLAAGAAKGGSVAGVNVTVAGGAFTNAFYAGGFGDVEGRVKTDIAAGTFSTNVFAGALCNFRATGASTTEGEILLKVAGGEFSKCLYAGAAVTVGSDFAPGAPVHVVGDITAELSGGTATGADFCVYGGGYAAGTNAATNTAAAYAAGNVDITVSGGTWGSAPRGGRGIFGGVYASGVKASVEDVDITIAAGTVQNVYGGGWAQSNGTSVVTGDVNITIAGGSVGHVFGGGAYSTASGGSTSVAGDVSITIAGGTVNGNVYAGGQNENSTVAGDVTVKFAGNGTYSCGVYGYVTPPSATEGGAKTLDLTEFTGKLSGDIGGFDAIKFSAATAATLTAAADNVDNDEWAFDLAGTAGASPLLTWEGGSFAGDTVELDLAGATAPAAGWQIATGLTDADAAFSVNTGDAVKSLVLGDRIWGGVYDGYGFSFDDENGGVLKFSKLA